MTIHHHDPDVTVHHSDCLDVLTTMLDNSIDAIVTDPPYSLSFMSAKWDTHTSPLAFQRWCAAWTTEALRILKPGGHLLAFGGTRTWHRLAVAVEDAGFEVRDSIAWLYGTGFPKSLDVSKAIDKRGGNPTLAVEIGAAIKKARMSRGWTAARADIHFCGGSTNWSWFEGRTAGIRPPTPETFARIVAEWPELAPWAEKIAEAEREITREATRNAVAGDTISFDQRSSTERERRDIPALDVSVQWAGWGTALKPAFEPIVVARKPLVGTVAANVLAHGTGALNIDATRVGDEARVNPDAGNKPGGASLNMSSVGMPQDAEARYVSGRWPTNVVLDDHTAAALDTQSAPTMHGAGQARTGTEAVVSKSYNASAYEMPPNPAMHRFGDSGGASRFFPVFKYQAKAPTRERPTVNGIAHPTCKPLALMRWLVRLVTPPGGTVLDMFAGSGTTIEACILESFRCVAIERETDYLPLIDTRIQRAQTAPLLNTDPTLFDDEDVS